MDKNDTLHVMQERKGKEIARISASERYFFNEKVPFVRDCPTDMTETGIFMQRLNPYMFMQIK